MLVRNKHNLKTIFCLMLVLVLTLNCLAVLIVSDETARAAAQTEIENSTAASSNYHLDLNEPFGFDELLTGESIVCDFLSMEFAIYKITICMEIYGCELWINDSYQGILPRYESTRYYYLEKFNGVVIDIYRYREYDQQPTGGRVLIEKCYFSQVTFDSQGGSLVTPRVFDYGQPYTLPSPTWNGYNFSGWYSGPGGMGKYYSSSGVWAETGDITLYACWTIEVGRIYMGEFFWAPGGSVLLHSPGIALNSDSRFRLRTADGSALGIMIGYNGAAPLSVSYSDSADSELESAVQEDILDLSEPFYFNYQDYGIVKLSVKYANGYLNFWIEVTEWKVHPQWWFMWIEFWPEIIIEAYMP